MEEKKARSHAMEERIDPMKRTRNKRETTRDGMKTGACVKEGRK
jgi:hypothetical protein